MAPGRRLAEVIPPEQLDSIDPDVQSASRPMEPDAEDRESTSHSTQTAEAAPPPKRDGVIRFDGRPVVLEAEAAGKLSGEDLKVYKEGAVTYLAARKRKDRDRNRHTARPSDGRLQVQVRVEAPTQVRLFGRVKSPTDSGKDNSFFVAAIPGNKPQSPQYLPWHTPAEKRWVWVSSQTLELKKGLNTILIAAREEGTMLDRIRISK